MIENKSLKIISTKNLYFAEIIDIKDEYGHGDYMGTFRYFVGYTLVTKDVVEGWFDVLSGRKYSLVSCFDEEEKRGIYLNDKLDIKDSFISYYDALKLIREKTVEKYGIIPKKVKVKKISKTKRD